MTTLFLMSAGLLAAACLVLMALRGKWHTIEKVEFVSSADNEDPIRISGLLVRSRACGCRRLPGLVLCPGLFANREIYLGLCRRIANLGVAVLVIDLRGHGHSGGSSTFGKSEAHDVWAAIDVLGARNDIDPERLGVIGHSLGGIAATRAGFEQPVDRIRAAVAIYCWKGFGDAVEATFGPLERFVARWWHFFGWSRRFSVTDPDAVEERSVIDRLDAAARINYMLVVGSRDPLTDMTRSKEILARVAGQPSVEPGVTYGRFENRSARRLEIIQGANHWSVLSRRSTFVAIRKWLHEGLGVEETGKARGSAALGVLGLTRKASVLLHALSTLAFAGCLMSVLSPEQAFRNRPTTPLATTIMATAVFLLCSALAIPAARSLRLKPFLPHWGADIVSLISASRAVLFVPALALIAAGKGTGQGFPLEAMGLVTPVVCVGLVASGLLFLWILCSWNLMARVNRFTTLWPVVPIRLFLLLLGVLFLCYLAEESVFRAMIQRQLSGLGPISEVLLSAVAYSMAASIGMTAAVWPLFPSASFAAAFRSRSITLLPVVFVFAVAVFFVHGLVAALLYHFTGTIVASALFLALLVSFLFTGPIGTRTY